MYMFSSLRFNVLILHLGKVYHFTIISFLMYPSCFLFFCYSIAILFGLKVLVFFLFHLLPSDLQLFIIVFQCLLKGYLDSILYIFTLPTSHFMPNVFHYMHQTCYIFEVGSGLSPGETWIDPYLPLIKINSQLPNNFKLLNFRRTRRIYG